MIAAIYARKSADQPSVPDEPKSVTRQAYMPVLIAVLLASACSTPKTTVPPVPPVDSARVQQSVSDEVSQLRLTEMCAATARQFWKEGSYEKLNSTGQVWGYFSHYNRRLKRCLIQTQLTTFVKGQGSTTEHSIADAFEGIDIAGASNIERADATVLDDDVLNGTSERIPHTREWFKRLMAE